MFSHTLKLNLDNQKHFGDSNKALWTGTISDYSMISCWQPLFSLFHEFCDNRTTCSFHFYVIFSLFQTMWKGEVCSTKFQIEDVFLSKFLNTALPWLSGSTDFVQDYGPYSQRDFKPRLTKHNFNDFSIGVKLIRKSEN